MSGSPLQVFDCALEGTNFIEASAGTGKTWNLCGLYLRLLLEKRLTVQQILVVTFTHAATAELKTRIRARLAETLARLRGEALQAGDPFVDDLLAALRAREGHDAAASVLQLDRALQDFDEAAIFTIHGFCQRALADTPFAAGLPMSMEALADDTELRLQVVHDFWRSRVAVPSLPPLVQAHLLSRGDTPAKWAEHLKRRLARPTARLLFAPELQPSAHEFDPALERGALDLANAHAAARQTWRQERARIVDHVRACLPQLNGQSYKETTIERAAAEWDELLAGADPLAVSTAPLKKIELFTWRKLVPRKGQPPVPPHAFFDEATRVLDCIDALGQSLDLARSRLIRELLEEGPKQLARLKRDLRVVTFDDMLANLHRALTVGAPGEGGEDGPDSEGNPPRLAALLRARFPAALIDEFQDTDPLQDAIFQTLYGAAGCPLFLVGDPKQAIYGFRNADLPTYLQARERAQRLHTLVHNQRSAPELIEGLNALFTVHERPFVLEGLRYERVSAGAKPRPAWSDRSQPRAALQLWQLPAAEDAAPMRKSHAERAAAQACAGEIARLLAAARRGEVRFDGRPLAGGDIAVLVRSHAHGSLVRQGLAALGVASVELSQASIFQSPDAEELERLLAAILEPGREGVLRAALATSLMGFDAAALEGLAADEARMLGLVARLAEYRERWLHRGLGVMLRGLVAQEGVHARLLARPDGERRLTNLLHLLECLHEASEHSASPQALMRWLQAQRADPRSDDALQLRLESDRNLVQIVTIHKSKGLEYPVVFCPLLWCLRSSASSSTQEGRESRDDTGAWVLDYRGGQDTPAQEQARKLQAFAEDMRLVYVALTRAIQRCYLVVGAYAPSAYQPKEDKPAAPTSLHSRLNFLVAGAGMAPADWLETKKPTPARTIEAAWRTLADAHPGRIALDPLPGGPWERLEPPALSPDDVAAQDPPARIPPAWRLGSYSSLAQGSRHEGAAVDHDARADTAKERDEGEDRQAPGRAAAHAGEDDILHFPRGPQAGDCLHTLFERADFTDPATWPAAAEQALREHPLGPSEGDAAHRWPRMLQRMLQDVVSAPLQDGVLLREVPTARRLVELEFNLPATLCASTLVGLMREHGYPAPALTFGTLQGFLRGFIDLVFEHGERFFIVDWKSNHLGHAPADYAVPRLEQAMQAQGYHLQLLLYTAALHRYLQRRLPGYDYERHFGGALYLFVRGVRPGWVDEAGRSTGVHADRPPLRLVERILALCTETPQPQAPA